MPHAKEIARGGEEVKLLAFFVKNEYGRKVLFAIEGNFSIVAWDQRIVSWLVFSVWLSRNVNSSLLLLFGSSLLISFNIKFLIGTTRQIHLRVFMPTTRIDRKLKI